MATQTRAEKIISTHAKLKGDRYNFENQWQEIQWLVRPNTGNFTTKLFIPGDRRTLNIFDSTAPYCNGQLAAGLHSTLTSSTDRWFNLATPVEALMENNDVLMWLEIVSDIIYLQYSMPRAMLSTSLHEVYLDQGAYGTSVLYQDADIGAGQVRFQSFPLSESYVNTDGRGRVNAIYRKFDLQYQAVADYFGEENLPPDLKKMGEKDRMQNVAMMHGIYPRENRQYGKVDSLNLAFESCWICVDTKEEVKEEGFNEFPYQIPRWLTNPGEIYGRSPAMECLPTIKMVNEIAKTMIRVAQKHADPPLIISEDAYKKNLRTKAGSVIYREPGEEPPMYLEPKGQTNLTIENLQSQQEDIKRAFFLDQLIMPMKKERQSVLERQQNRDEQLRQMSPNVGRLEAELCGPMLLRTYQLLLRMGAIPPPPPQLRGAKMSVEYISPASRAQVLGKATAITQIIQDMLPLMQIDNTVIDIFDIDATARQLTIYRDTTRKIIRSPRDVAAIRKQRADQAAAQKAEQVAGAAESGSKALLNTAQAHSLMQGEPVAA